MSGPAIPGQSGIDYLAINIGAIRDVPVIATTGHGAVGNDMRRKWPVPALLQRVEVQGFDTGIAVANTEYGVTMDHVTLQHQLKIGLANDSNAISAAHVTIDALRRNRNRQYRGVRWSSSRRRTRACDARRRRVPRRCPTAA